MTDFVDTLTKVRHKIKNPYAKDELESLDSAGGLGSGSRGPGADGIDMNPTPKYKPKRLEKAPTPNNPDKDAVEWLDKLSFANAFDQTLLRLKNQLTGSVLDYPKPGLDPQIWQADGTLHPNIKHTILKKIVDFFKEKGINKHIRRVVKYVYIIGSLTSYQYNSKSDLDTHIGIDIDDLKKALSKTTFWVSDEELADLLNKHWKDELNEKEPVLAPGTEHPLEFYFEIKGYTGAERADGVYNLLKDKWIQEPRTVDYDFDLDELYPKVIDEASHFLKSMDAELGDVKRTISDIAFLKETLARFPKEKRKLFKEKIREKIRDINFSIQELVEKGQNIIDERKEKYNPLAPSNIHFKYLQRYGYIWLIKQLEEVLEDKMTEEVSVQDLEDVKAVQEVLDQFDCLEDSTVKLSEAQVIYEDSTIQTSEVSKEILDQIRGIQKTIDKDLLSHDEDARGWVHGGMQELLHVTVLFGVNAEDFEKAKEICKDFKDIEIEATHVDYFDVDTKEGKFSCAVVKCSSPRLEELHNKLKDNLENKHKFDYKPHITIAYLQHGSRLGDIEFKPVKWIVGDLEMGMPDGSLKRLATKSDFEILFGGRVDKKYERKLISFLTIKSKDKVVEVLERINNGEDVANVIL
jgi:2'-5' RNA ligase